MTLRIKLIKRIFLALLLLTVGTMLILRGLGLVSNSAVLIAFLAVELPTLLVVLTLTGFELYQLKKTRGLRGQEFLTAIEEEQPLLRFAILEARTLFALIEVLLGRKHGVVSSTLGFSYAKGTLAIPSRSELSLSLKLPLSTCLSPGRGCAIYCLSHPFTR